MQATILTPSGRLDTTAAPRFEREVLAAIEAGASRLLIDFSDLAYISSAGLRVVLMAAKRLRAPSGQLALCAMQPPIAEVFEISGFNAIFSIHADRATALATFG